LQAASISGLSAHAQVNAKSALDAEVSGERPFKERKLVNLLNDPMAPIFRLRKKTNTLKRRAHIVYSMKRQQDRQRAADLQEWCELQQRTMFPRLSVVHPSFDVPKAGLTKLTGRGCDR